MDSAWAKTRRARVRFFFYILIGVPLTIYLLVQLYRAPTCFDGRQNQGELGPDCGGVCEYYCPWQAAEMNTVWTSAVEVSPGWWSAIAYVDNPNFDMRFDNRAYQFKLYDAAGALLFDRTGVVSVDHDPVVAIFEGRMAITGAQPARTEFMWLEPALWRKAGSEREVLVEQYDVRETRPGQEIVAMLQNEEPAVLRNVNVVVIVYDRAGGVLATSETFVDIFPPDTKKRVTFWWPHTFEEPYGRIEIVTRVPPQD